MKLKKIINELVVNIANMLIEVDGRKTARYIWTGHILTIVGVGLWSFSLGSITDELLVIGHIAVGSICSIYIFCGSALLAAGIRAQRILRE